MSLVSRIKRPGPNGFGYGSTAEEVTAGIDLSAKTYLLTGCNAGLGLETLRVLSMRGAHVIAAARDTAKAAKAIAAAGAQGHPVACELSEAESVRVCIDEVRKQGRPLDGIICNAGIMALPQLQQKYGIELQLLTNHVGHFILVTGLLDRLTDDGRVVMLSSSAHKMAPPDGIDFDNLSGQRGYSPWRAYGQSKLANLLFARHLAKRFGDSGKTANAVHPGVIQTELSRHMGGASRFVFSRVGALFMKSIPQGAATQCYVACHPDVATTSGEYFADSNPASTSQLGRDDALAEKLWSTTEHIVAKLSTGEHPAERAS